MVGVITDLYITLGWAEILDGKGWDKKCLNQSALNGLRCVKYSLRRLPIINVSVLSSDLYPYSEINIYLGLPLPVFLINMRCIGTGKGAIAREVSETRAGYRTPFINND